MSYNKITVVINTFHSEDKIDRCLNSINPKIKILVIENSNNSNFKLNLEKKYSNVTCYLTGENLGYAKGNNLGLSKVTTEYALILNPDAYLDNDTLNNLINSAKNLNNFAIIGPAKQNEYSNKNFDETKPDIFEVDHVKGFAMFLNMKEFNDIGFFDENIFIYLEEIDLCKRLKKNNKKIFLAQKVIIHHVGGSSHNAKINFEMELSRNWHWMWSTFYYNKKHYGYFISIIRASGKLCSSLIKMIFYYLIFNKTKQKIYFQRFSGLINSILGRKSWYRPRL